MKDIKETIKLDTHWAKQYYKHRKQELDNYETDPRKEVRTRSQECKVCFYLRNGLALQAFTEYSCKYCKKDCMHHNSRTPKYCIDCSIELEVCRTCGSEMD